MILKTNNEEAIISTYDDGQFRINYGNDYFIIIEDNKMIGMFEIQPITKITGILHLHIKKEFRHKKLANKAINDLLEYLKESPYYSLVGTVPVNNKAIIKVIKKTNAQECGVLKDSIIYKDQLQDMLLFELKVQ